MILSRARFDAWFRLTWVALLYLLVATAVLNAFMTKWEFRGDGARFGLEALIHQRASRPFIYRVLSPAIVKVIADAVPEPLVEQAAPLLLEGSRALVFRGAETQGLRARIQIWQGTETWGAQRSLDFHVAYAYLLISLLAVLLVVRRLTAVVVNAGDLFTDVAPAVALVFLPLSFHLGGYLYDFAELALLGAAILCIVERRWGWFYLAFVLAILNKESDVLIVGFFAALTYDRLSRKALAAHVALQVALGGLIVFAIRYAFRLSPGEAAQFQLFENIRYWLGPAAYFGIMEAYVPLVPVPEGFNVVTLFLIGVLLARASRVAPPQVVRFFWVSLLLNVPLLVVFGYLDEIRNLSLTFPAFYFMACYGIRSVYGSALEQEVGLETLAHP